MATTPVHAIATGALQETDLVREALTAEYEIIEELGRGGMALVYRARDRQLEREVAIKVLPFSLAFDAEFVERFQREARTAAQLEHPNIISIYRVGRSGRVIYFVMKYLRGGSLSTVLHERKKLNPPEIRRLLLEAGGALGYAAQRGIVHRDIKPDNIMFDEFGQCLLTDFGIAKAASGQKLTGTGMSIGTPHYMSPEQARAQAIDGRSDIYSLGVVAYQCLTGTVPYDGEDSFSIGYKHITEPIPTPSLITADERRIFEVIKRMLMKDPADRFQSCEELVASIQGQPTAAPGAVRASTAAAALAGGRVSSATVPSPSGGMPPIMSQPTTPIDSPLVNRRATPNERRDLPRRVADRSLAMRGGSGSSWAWLWIVVAVLGGAGGAFYYYKARGFAPGPAVAEDSAGVATDTTALRDTTAASTPSLRDGGGPAPVKPAASAPAAPSTPVAPPTPAPPRPSESRGSDSSAAVPAAVVSGDSGGIRVVGLPKGSTVMIDEKPVSETVTRLLPGPHAVGVSAPKFNFYADTVVVRPGEIAEVSPQLTPIGSPDLPKRRVVARAPSRCEPGPGYNADNSCFEERPKPVTPPFVPVPDEVTETPRPSLLWVKVSTEGRTVDVSQLRPSNDSTFERAVRNFVWSLTWHPALKAGSPVEAWTQMLFPPAPK
ncbi:MAG TPA: serine/threonine-protein kinase [Gemmatimonadales bacterium]|nr:serine/threonine-protein kinase [Gemmatimonadales bacterium]